MFCASAGSWSSREYTIKDGKGLTIKQTETSNVEISQEQLAQIIEASANLRNNLIKKN
jgi:hypothetical protein